MKKVTSLLAILLLLINCQESKDSTPANQVSPFNRNVGKQISMDVAERWMNRYKEKNNAAKTEDHQGITEAQLSTILTPLDDKLGVSFHRAIDKTGEYHILVVPIKEGQSTWSSEQILDATNNVLIDAQTAEDWADRYKNENPDGIWSHFFGIHVFESEFDTIQLVDALNDQDAPQLLLFISRNSNAYNGRIQGDGVEVYDASVPCPTICNGAEI
jgi:lambda repressor-like predicted transcriptional regulator